MAAVGEKGVGSEERTWEAKGIRTPKTKAHQLEEFLYSVTKVHSSMPSSFKNNGRTGGGCCGG